MFFLLHNILFASLFFFGMRGANSKTYWKNGFYIIIIYTLVEGLRWGRGIDYNLYYYRYQDIARGYETIDEPVYYYFCQSLSALGIPYQGYVLLCSAILIFSVVFFLQDHAKIAKYAFPLFFILTEIYAENLVRWHLGFSFILIGLRYLLKGNVKLYLLYSLIGMSLHYGLAIVIVAFLLVKFIKKPLLKPAWSISLYLIILLLWNNSYMLLLSGIVGNLGIERFQYYSDNADIWLTSSNQDAKDFSLIFTIRQFVFCAFFLYYGYKLIIKKKNLVYLYNLMTIGMVFFIAAANVELWTRINNLFYYFAFVIGGHVFYYIFDEKIIRQKMAVPAGKFMLILCLFISIRYSLTTNPIYTSFIWDANGRKTIPMEYFIDKRYNP